MDATPTAPVSTASTEALIKSLTDDLALVKQAVAAGKAGGASALVPLIPQVVTAVEKGVTEVKAAIPEIKTGYLSTEFWAPVGACIVGSIYFGLTGHDIPVNLGVCASGVIAIYIAARTLLKAKTAAPAA